MKLSNLILTIGVIYLLNSNLGFVEDGKSIFEEKCSVCHTIGQGIKIGPDLKDVYKRRTEEWLRRMIKEPDKMIKEDPVAIQLLNEFKGVAMPNSGLKDEEVELVMAFLKSTEGAKKVQKEIVKIVKKEGGVKSEDILRGEELFVGSKRLVNGGPSCLSCHNFRGVKKLGGGKLGPDLSAAYQKYGEQGLTSILDSFPFPTMNPIYAKRLLTEDEKKYLKAFLIHGTGNISNYNWQVIGGAIFGFVFLLLLSKIIWQSKIKDVRLLLIQKSIGG